MPTAALPLLALLPTLWSPSPGRQGERWTQEQLEQAAEEVRHDIEALRERAFLRPVQVELANHDTFLEYARARMEATQPENEFVAAEEIAKHLGLVPPSMDLLAATMDVMKEQAGGFYDPGADTFYLMETFTGGIARIILAHELGHALDDQIYDLDGMLEERLANGDAATAFQAVVEGSGSELMQRWMLGHMGELSIDDLTSASQMGAEELARVPPFVWKPLLAVYVKGQAFLEDGYGHLKNQAGRDGQPKPSVNDAIHRAFSDPPRSTEQVLHPERYWAPGERDDPRAVTHAIGDLPQGWELRRRDVMGELFLALLTTPVDARDPLDVTNPFAVMATRYTNDAAAGWGGDEVVLLAKGPARLVHLATCWDSADDANEFADAVEAVTPALDAALVELAGGDTERAGSRLEVREARDEIGLATWSGVDEAEARRVLAAIAFHAAPRAPAAAAPAEPAAESQH